MNESTAVLVSEITNLRQERKATLAVLANLRHIILDFLPHKILKERSIQKSLEQARTLIDRANGE